MNDDTIGKATQIQRLRREVEKLRERNSDLINEILPLDNFLYKTHKKINHLLDGDFSSSYSDYNSSDSVDSDGDFKAPANLEEITRERRRYVKRMKFDTKIQIFNMKERRDLQPDIPIYYLPPSNFDEELKKNIATYRP